MEDKKKTLKDLETSKADTLKVLDGLLEKLGESLISRMDKADSVPAEDKSADSAAEGDSPSVLLGEKKRILKEISDSEVLKNSIEADLFNLGKLEDEINKKEREKSEKSREIPPVYSEMGRLILRDPGFENFTVSFKQALNNITGKIDFQQKKMEELDNSDNNILTRLGNGVKGMMTKASLTKNEAELEKLYRYAGEQFFVGLDNPSSGRISADEISLADEGEIAALKKKGLDLRDLQVSLKDEIDRLRSERRETAQALDQKGNPTRRISELEIFITRSTDEIKKVHLRFGALVRSKKWKNSFAPFTEDEKTIYDKVAAIDETLKITEAKIEFTRDAITIDNQKAEISKLNDAINDKRKRIADAEKSIAELEGQIADAQKIIDELTEKHGKDK